MRLAALALAAALGGCATGPHVADFRPAPVARELESTPFFPQEQFQCGPAALATILVASGVAVTPQDLEPRIYLPGRKGSLQPELVAATRHYDRVPYRIPPDLGALFRVVAEGTPVLVLENLGVSFWPAWHYAVVIGYDAEADTVVLRSGLEAREVVSLKRFERRWRLAENWALVASPPGTPVTVAAPVEWLKAAAAFEQTGKPEISEAAYLAATQRWPDEVLGWQLLGNLRYGQRDLAGAEAAYRRAVDIDATAVSLNNLAQIQFERGCPGPAASTLRRAEGLAADAAVTATLQRTRAEIEAFRGKPSANCRTD